MIIAILEAGLVRRRPSEMLMAPVAGQPMIWRMVERARRARTLTKVVVAASLDAADDALTGYLTERGVCVFRGDPADALASYVRCVRASGAGHAAFVAADTPLLDPNLIDEAVRYALTSRSDMIASQAYPLGLAVTVATDVALMQAQTGALPKDAHLHPCDLIAAHPQHFQTASFRARRDWSALDWRADTPAGFLKARAMFEALWPEDADFDVEQALFHLSQQGADETRAASAA
jgi:spore coat polysaccharide biosynthesis protein SpsF